MSLRGLSSSGNAAVKADSAGALFSAKVDPEARRVANRVTMPPVPKARPVSAFEFTTLDLPAEERFMAWRASYAPMIDLVQPDGLDVAFAGDQLLWDLGSLAFSRVRTDALGFASLARRERRDPIDHWVISLLLKGSSRTITPLQTFDGHPGSLQIHPLGKVFEGRITDSEVLQLLVPRDFFRGMTHLLEAAEFAARDDAMARLLAGYMGQIARCLPSLDVRDVPRLITATRAMILACTAPSADHLAEADDTIANVLLDRARRFVQANMVSGDLDVASVQRELGISRSRLYRLFEPYGGVVHYIQRRRLLDAHAALADPGDTRRILDIAEERGFTDSAEFSRAFRREFGYSPRDVRATGKRNPSNRSASDLERVAPVDRLGVLLRRLQA
ncbi:AraC family transcriptional regulator [Mesorhizobium sp. L-8-10]|uniref:helix-turn-helix domain-containing protein n=1 Tax=Mesorhizobium sp. L-8-10 TaxID=2744523 RepID=UPI00193818EC|nr:helix-turn-helix domain-containing protein [Mesorhizobium sp. L-8-10]BCH31919.1 AraC family transcriptional regulator [Mesorhizobium sp. L-8-10]